MTYISNTAWPTGSGWTSGAVATITSNIQALLNSTGSGTDATHHRRHLPAAGAYYPTNGLDLTGLDHITIEGGGSETTYGHTGGATIQTQGSPSPPITGTTSVFWTRNITGGVDAAEDLRFHCLTVEGTGVPGSTVASTTAGNGGENQHGWALMGVNGATIAHCIADKLKGDGVYIVDSHNGSISGYHTRDVLMRNMTIKRNGRMGIAVVWGQRITGRDIDLDDIAYAAVDVEPDHSFQVNGDLDFQRFRVGTYGWDPDFVGVPFLITRPSGASGTFSLTGYTKMIDWTIYGTTKTLLQDWYHLYLEAPWAQFDKSGPATVTGNVRTVSPRPGPAVRFFSRAGGALYANNTGHLSSGSFVASSGNNGTLTNGGGNS